MYHRKSPDIVIVAALAVFTLLVAFLGLRSAASPETLPVWFLPVGVAMILVLPGYVMVKAFLPTSDGATVLLLSVSLSLVLDVVGILVINTLPWGLGPTSWALWSGGITLLGSLAVAIKRRTRPDLRGNAFSWPKFNVRVILPLFAAAVITIVAAFATRSAFVQSGTTFTQLWVLPASTEAPYKFQIGIGNYERQNQKYDLYVASQGTYIYSESGIEIAPDKTWTTELSLYEKPKKPIVVYLYLSDAPGVIFRTVQLAPTAFSGPIPPARPNP